MYRPFCFTNMGKNTRLSRHIGNMLALVEKVVPFFRRTCDITNARSLCDMAMNLSAGCESQLHGRNVIRGLHKYCWCCHMIEMLPGRWNSFVSLAPWKKYSTRVISETLFGQHSRNPTLLLQAKRDLCNMPEMFSASHRNCYIGRMAEIFPLCAREIMFEGKVTNVPLMLRSKRDFGYMAEKLFLVPKLTVHSAGGKYGGDMQTYITRVPVICLPC